MGIEEVDLGVSGIGNRGSLEVHRMGAKVIQEGEQASAAEREVIERSGRSVFRLAIDDVQDRIIAAIGIEPDPTDLDAVCLERRAEARPHSKNFAVKGDGVVHASARSEEHTSELQSLMR